MISPANLLETARILRIPPRWLKHEARAGRVPSIKIGRKLWFNPNAVALQIANRAAESSNNLEGQNMKPKPTSLEILALHGNAFAHLEHFRNGLLAAGLIAPSTRIALVWDPRMNLLEAQNRALPGVHIGRADDDGIDPVEAILRYMKDAGEKPEPGAN